MKKNKSGMTRRKFIQSSAGAFAAVSAYGLIPASGIITGPKDNKPAMLHRKLGKTGLDVSLLSFGGGSQFLRNQNGDWEQLLEAALEGGINMFDTASTYTSASFNQGGSKSPDSEDRFGQLLTRHRNKIILSTKIESRDPEKAKPELEASLKRLKTDHVDIIFIHAILPSDSTSEIEKGLYKTMLSLKESGMTKYIGFSSMDSAERSAEMLEKLEFDAVLLAMNATNYGNFINITLPAARKKNVGVIAMKALRDIVGKDATAKELLEYVLTQEGVSSVLVGHYGIKNLQENLKLVSEYSNSGISSLNHKELERRMAAYSGPHTLSWARPGYVDGGLLTT